jgi:ubiquinone/menaquinone biosynthesis C-methylase UbiE
LNAPQRPLQRVLFAWILLLPFALSVEPARSQETSILPGINDKFRKPDPAEWVERFEQEGREIYAHRDAIVAWSQVKPGMDVADVGAGTGLFTRLFARATGDAGQVYAVDIAQEFVDHVLKTSKEEGLKNVVGVVCDDDDCGLKPDSIDVAFICDTYHHFEFPQKSMKSIYRALRPGGSLLVIDFHRIEGVSSDFIMGHVRAGQEVFRREIEEAGFEFVKENKKLLKDNYFMRFISTPTGSPSGRLSRCRTRRNRGPGSSCR